MEKITPQTVKSKALMLTKKGSPGALMLTKKPPVPRKTKGTMYA